MFFVTTTSILYFSIFVFSALTIVHFYFKKCHSYWKKRGIKSVPAPNFFGNFSDCIFMRKSLKQCLCDIYFHGKGEKFIGYYVFGEPFLMLRDPEAIKNVLVKDFKNFPNRCLTPNHSDFNGSANIFALKYSAWKVLRPSLTPVFSSGKFKNMLDLALQTTEELDLHLANAITNGDWNVVDIKDLCEKYASDVVGLTMFGMKINALNNTNQEFLKEGKKLAANTYRRYFSYLALFFMPQLVKLLNITFYDSDVPKFFNNILPDFISERSRIGIKKNDLIDALLNIKKTVENENNDNLYYFQPKGLIATAIFFFFAGYETSAATMYFVLYELSKNPDIQNKLRKEILEALEETDGKITMDMVTNLPYLDMVTSEGLRMYPVLDFLNRRAVDEYTFPGTNLTIEKGTPIIIPMTAMHMDPNNFPNPQVFDPERFSLENKKKITPFTYFPFGKGPRNCIGMRIGLAQTKAGLIKIISKYELKPCKETPIPLEYSNCSLVTQSKTDMKVHFRRIIKNA